LAWPRQVVHIASSCLRPPADTPARHAPQINATTPSMGPPCVVAKLYIPTMLMHISTLIIYTVLQIIYRTIGSQYYREILRLIKLKIMTPHLGILSSRRHHYHIPVSAWLRLPCRRPRPSPAQYDCPRSSCRAPPHLGLVKGISVSLTHTHFARDS